MTGYELPNGYVGNGAYVEAGRGAGHFWSSSLHRVGWRRTAVMPCRTDSLILAYDRLANGSSGAPMPDGEFDSSFQRWS